MTFGGGGVHFCLGASLARAEIKATMRQVVERLPDLELAGPPNRLHSDFVNGIKTMPVRFTPTAPAVQEGLTMRTPLCDELGIEFPIFAFTHCRDVVAAVSKAGGFGVLGAVGFTPEQLEIELDWIDEHVGDHPYGVDIVIPGKYEGMDATWTPSDLAEDAAGRWCRRGTSTSPTSSSADHGVPELPDGGGRARMQPARLDRGHRHPAGRGRPAPPEGGADRQRPRHPAAGRDRPHPRRRAARSPRCAARRTRP